MRALVACLGVLALAGCANPFRAFYRGPHHALEMPGYVASGLAPEIIEIVNIDEEVRRAVRNGYSVVGYSAFDAPRLPLEAWQARDHAREIGAQLVLVRSRYRPAFGERVPVGAADAPALGSRLIAMPEAHATSDFVTVFMAQRRDPLAAELIDLDAPARHRGGERRPGVKVVEVVENGPAHQAGIHADDVILAIDGQPVLGVSYAVPLIRKSAGRTARLTVVREGSRFESTVRLGR